MCKSPNLARQSSHRTGLSQGAVREAVSPLLQRMAQWGKRSNEGGCHIVDLLISRLSEPSQVCQVQGAHERHPPSFHAPLNRSPTIDVSACSMEGLPRCPRCWAHRIRWRCSQDIACSKMRSTCLAMSAHRDTRGKMEHCSIIGR